VIERSGGCCPAGNTGGVLTTMLSGLRRSALWIFAPVVAAGRVYGSWAVRAPFATGAVTAGVQTTCADAFAQLVVEKREKIDWRRNAIFTGFGVFYVGGFQYYLYSVKFKQWCGSITQAFGHRGAAPVKV